LLVFSWFCFHLQNHQYCSGPKQLSAVYFLMIILFFNSNLYSLVVTIHRLSSRSKICLLLFPPFYFAFLSCIFWIFCWLGYFPCACRQVCCKVRKCFSWLFQCLRYTLWPFQISQFIITVCCAGVINMSKIFFKKVRKYSNFSFHKKSKISFNLLGCKHWKNCFIWVFLVYCTNIVAEYKKFLLFFNEYLGANPCGHNVVGVETLIIPESCCCSRASAAPRKILALVNTVQLTVSHTSPFGPIYLSHLPALWSWTNIDVHIPKSLYFLHPNTILVLSVWPANCMAGTGIV